MEIAVTVPDLGDSVTESTITRWLKSVGDSVELHEPLLEVATDKVDIEIPAPATGFLHEILEPEDAVVPVGAIIALIGAPTKERPVSSPPPTASAASGFTAVVDVSAANGPESDRGLRDRVEKLPRIRRVIARRMVESLRTAAQLTTVVEADLSSIGVLRDKHKGPFFDHTGAKLSFLPFVVVAAVESIARHPIINTSLNTDCTEVTYHGAVHLGLAVDSDKGLMVPVIRNVQGQSISEISRSIAHSAAAVRKGTIQPDDFAGGTFTITNTGSRGALFDTPIINQPQSAILGVGTVVQRLVPSRDDTGSLNIEVRSMVYLSLSYDHRIIDGADAARYLSAVRGRLEAGFDESELQL
jgi:2-oxoglutarate dehydrogenase E2 component (dihydrolipoamide succinyltransferase)